MIDLGRVSLSRIVSSPVIYRRRMAQISAGTESHHLVTIPLAGDLVFDQQDLRFHCPANSFLMERGDLPYELHQPSDNELVVVKVSHSLLEGHLPRGTAFKGQTFAPLAIAGLFVDFIRSSICHGREIEPSHYASVSGQILDLLALTLTSRDGAVESAETSVQEAHLSRIKALIRNSLFEPGLTPAHIAAKCRLSVSYLHRLFASTGTTIGRWIREERLLASDRALRNPRYRNHWRPSLNSLASRTSRNSADTTSGVLAERQAKFALRPAMRRDMQNGSGTKFELARCWLNRGASQPTPRSFLKSRRCILVEKRK